MEEENSSLPDVTPAAFQQDPSPSLDHQWVNGGQQDAVSGDLSPKAERDSPEEAEPWVQIIWPVRPVACTSPLLSFATVQWDMPDASAGTPSAVTHSSLANELDGGDTTSAGTASPSLQPQDDEEDVEDELFREEVRETEERSESELLNGDSFEPCDAAGVSEATTQEEEESTPELLGSSNENIEEIPLRTEEEEEEEEEGDSASSGPVVSLEIINPPQEEEGSEDEVESFVDVNLEEELEEPAVLLTKEGDSEEEQTLPNGVEAEETDEEGAELEEDEEEGAEPEEDEEEGAEPEEDEEEGAELEEDEEEESEEAQADGRLNHAEVTEEPRQTDPTGQTLNTEELVEPQQEEVLEEERRSGAGEDAELQEDDPTEQTEELEMCETVDQKPDPEESEAAENIEEASKAEEIRELTEKVSLVSETASEELETPPQPEEPESERLEMTEETEQIQEETEMERETAELSEELETPPQPEEPESERLEMTEEIQEETEMERETAELSEESTPSEQTVIAEDQRAAEPQEQTEPPEQNEQQTSDEQPEQTDEPEMTEQLSPEPEVTQQSAEAELSQQDGEAEVSHQAADEEEDEEEEEEEGVKDENKQTLVSNGVQHKPPDTAVPRVNGGEVDRESACRLAERLFRLDGVQRVEVVRHLDKDNDFSRAVGEEYLKFFDFTGQTLDHALRSFLKVVVLIGETQERERVLQQFACRFHQCNPGSFSSSGAVLALTCALMLLNTDLHGQNVGKSMSSSKFVSNLDGMNEGENFSKDFLKSLYNSIKSEQLEWAVDEEELKSSVLAEEDQGEDVLQRSKANPFQDVPHNKTASVVKKGFLQRKLHADIDGKRTPWGKRGWKTFYGVLRGMVLYLQKDDCRRDQATSEEVVSVHHSLAEQAAEYTKKPHVFRLQTADWRVFLFQTSTRAEMHSWINRINLVSALHSSPPFPAAVGSQRRFCRPILPASESVHTLESQLQSHAKMLESFKVDLSSLQQNLPEGKKVKAKELEEQRVRAEYLQHEVCRYETYIQVLEAWRKVKTSDGGALTLEDLTPFDKAVCADSEGEMEEGTLKKAYSSPSLEAEAAPPTVIKVRRNISERRTYRRTIIPRWNKES